MKCKVLYSLTAVHFVSEYNKKHSVSLTGLTITVNALLLAISTEEYNPIAQLIQALFIIFAKVSVFHDDARKETGVPSLFPVNWSPRVRF